MGLEDLGQLLDQVPQAEPVNILLKEGYWALPFQGKWLGVYESKVPAIHELDKIQLVDEVFLVFSDGTYLPLYGVFGWEEEMETLLSLSGSDLRKDWVYILGKEGLIQGLDFPAYEKIYLARQAIVEAEKAYTIVLNELGVSQEWQGDQYEGYTQYSREGIPGWTV